MRLIFSICKIFSFCFVVVYTFSSCKTTLNVNGTEVPKKVTIFITGNATTGELTMKDSAGGPAEVFDAWAGQKIKWEVDKSTIKHVDSMPPKTANINAIFKKKPHKIFLSKNWQGKIQVKEELTEHGVIGDGGKYYYDYDIKWTDKKNGITHTKDPRIQVKS
jgi:hypothetical protein